MSVSSMKTTVEAAAKAVADLDAYSVTDSGSALLGEASAEQQKIATSDAMGIETRNKKLSEILSAYTENYKRRTEQNQKSRAAFLIISLIILVVLAVVLPGAIIWLAATSRISNTVAATGLISALVSMVAAVVVLPKIIAEYLFSSGDDTINAEIVKKIIESDLEIRNQQM